MNWLLQHVPEGMFVDAPWLTRQGYSTKLRSKYVAAGWLERPAPRVYRRPRGSPTWEQLVISLQTLLAYDLAVGGRTALELHGFAHYLQQATTEVHLYGAGKPPAWISEVDVGVRFVHHNDRRLFRKELVSTAPHRLDVQTGREQGARSDSLLVRSWGPWSWPLVISTPERAILELLDELPDRESFHQADMTMEGLATLSPARLQKLLVDCRSVKVKRLFFHFADRHQHAWLKRLNRKPIDLGKGNRMLVKGGKFDPTYRITVPELSDGLR